jgi:hypothetical protein
MSVITKGRIFANGEQLTAEKLNVLVDEASFNSSTAVDNSTTRVSASGAITVKPQGITSTELAPSERWQNAYPVGSIYMNAEDSTDPSVLLGFGTWAAFGAGRVLIGAGSDSDDQPTPETVSFTAGDEGGEYNHTLTEGELPEHHHLAVRDGSVTETGDVTSSDAISEAATQTGSTYQSYRMRPATSGTFGNVGRTSQVGNGQAHNNLQPYIVVYMWKRTA